MRKKIFAFLQGGLGNQLFIYSAAKRLSVRTQAELVLDTESGFLNDKTYRRKYMLEHFNIDARPATTAERLACLWKIRRKTYRLFSINLFPKHSTYLLKISTDYYEPLLSLDFKKTLLLEGYWQSETYFTDIEDIIRKDLAITPPQDEMNRKMMERILASESVAVHVRYFHTPNSSSPFNLGETYYRKAISFIKERTDNPHFFIFSDIPDHAREVTGLSSKESTLLRHNIGDEQSYADLWLMSKCKHHVIANSTFSWWGAWLAGHSDQLVVAPGKMYSGKYITWGFDKLIPDHWNTIQTQSDE